MRIADDHSPPRRAGHRHQSRQGNRPRQLQRAVRCWSLLFGSKIASLYVQPHIGGDIALLTGVAKVVLERNAVDGGFIARSHRRIRRRISGSRPRHHLGRDRARLRRGTSDDRANRGDVRRRRTSAVFGWTMGITHHEHGVANVQSIVNLALLRGMVGRPRAGLLPIRGHSNVQGIGSMGVAPALKQEGPRQPRNASGASSCRLRRDWTRWRCMQAADQGEVRSAVCLGGNLFGSNPDAKFAMRALAKLDLITYLSTTLNTGHAWGRARETLILPVLARDEEPEPTTQESMFNFVRLSDGGPSRLRGAAQRSGRDRVPRRAACWATTCRSTGRHCGSTVQRPADDRPDHPRLRSRSPPSIRRSEEFHVAGRDLSHAAFRDALGQGAVCGPCRMPPLRRLGTAAAADDGALRGTVQHGRLRGRGHLSRPGSARRDPDQPCRHRAARAARRSARDRAQRRRRRCPASWCASSTSGPATL